MTAHERYVALEMERQPFLRRAEKAASLTIPSLIPPEGWSGADDLPDPYQSVGARGVNNLVAKLLLALFPPGSAFFRLSVDEYVLDALASRAGADAESDVRGQIEEALSQAERAVMVRFDQEAIRVALENHLKHLVVAGNGLLYMQPTGRTRFYDMRRFVVRRDADGLPREIILKQEMNPLSLPDAARAIFERRQTEQALDDSKYEPKATACLYTRIYRDGNRYRVYQEIEEQEIPGTQGTYPLDSLPWIAGSINRIDGEDYGRGYVDAYIGDLGSLERASQAMIQFAAAAAKILFFVNEGSTTSRAQLAKAPSGAVLQGRKDDVTILQMEKFADFQVTKAVADGIEQRLGEAFLVGSSARRDAERVTAEEIRLIAGELEQALGGIYSSLTNELQLPLVKVLLHTMTKSKAIPPLPKEVLHPSIITGMAALGRNADLQRLEMFADFMTRNFGDQAREDYLHPGNVGQRVATALGIDVKGLVRSDDEVQQIQQQRAAQQVSQRTLPAAIQAESRAAQAVPAPAPAAQ